MAKKKVLVTKMYQACWEIEVDDNGTEDEQQAAASKQAKELYPDEYEWFQTDFSVLERTGKQSEPEWNDWFVED